MHALEQFIVDFVEEGCIGIFDSGGQLVMSTSEINDISQFMRDSVSEPSELHGGVDVRFSDGLALWMVMGVPTSSGQVEVWAKN